MCVKLSICFGSIRETTRAVNARAYKQSSCGRFKAVNCNRWLHCVGKNVCLIGRKHRIKIIPNNEPLPEPITRHPRPSTQKQLRTYRREMSRSAGSPRIQWALTRTHTRTHVCGQSLAPTAPGPSVCTALFTPKSRAGDAGDNGAETTVPAHPHICTRHALNHMRVMRTR